LKGMGELDSWVLQTGISAVWLLPKLPLGVRCRRGVEHPRSSLASFHEKDPPHNCYYLFSSSFYTFDVSTLRLDSTRGALAPRLSRYSPPFRPCVLSSPLPGILLGPTPRRRTRLPNTTSSRANTGTHNFQNYFARSHPHRRLIIPPHKLNLRTNTTQPPKRIKASAFSSGFPRTPRFSSF
jgi:hypothetical protein